MTKPPHRATLFSAARCGALLQTEYMGHKFTAKCTKFAGHTEHPLKKHYNHFDHARRLGWAPEDPDRPWRDQTK